MNYLLDTCVISELASKAPDPNVVAWIDSVPADRVYLSVITVGEIRKGIEKLQDSRRKEALRSWLKEELLVRFQDRLVVLDLGALLAWGDLTASLARQGTPMPAMDSLLAATALHHDFVFVTRNEADFLRAGINLFNPWKVPT
jgi:tRNA(fMet)-specific endonuclease VapC